MNCSWTSSIKACNSSAYWMFLASLCATQFVSHLTMCQFVNSLKRHFSSGYSCKSCATGLQSLNCNYEITWVTCQTYQPHLSQALMVNIFHYLAHNITFLIIKTGSFRIQTNRALVVPMHIMKEQALQKQMQVGFHAKQKSTDERLFCLIYAS